MRKLKLYILLLFCTVLAGCEWLENPDDFKAQEVKLFARTNVHLSVGDATRSAVNSTDNQTLDIGLVRLDGDGYFVNCSSGLLTADLSGADPQNSYLRSVEDFSTAQFFQDAESNIKYTAWYPWPESADDRSSQGYSFSSGGTNSTVTFPITGESDIMYAEPVVGNMSSGFGVMDFKHALSLFRIYVYSSTSENVSWGNVTSVSITGVPSVCTLTLPANSTQDEYSIVYGGNSQSMEYTLPDGGMQILEGLENKQFIKEWVAAPSLPGQGSTNDMLNISVKTTLRGETPSTVSIAKDFLPGYAYDIILRFTDSGVISPEVKVADWPVYNEAINSNIFTSKTYFNLSGNGTANCYIVSSANMSYCFDATVKGNGNIDAFGGALAGYDINLSPVYVKQIWSEVPDFKLDTNLVVNGRVLFTVDGYDTKTDKRLKTEGNVLLGVYDSADINANPLWTWHIWITDKPQKQNYTKGYVVLDRNLGATSASSAEFEKSKGLFYQWGRPTPFRLVPDNTEASGKKLDATNSYTRVAPDVAVANPGVFYGRFNSNTSGADETQMVRPTDPNDYHDWVLRGEFPQGFPKVNNLWGYREVEHAKPIKTLYDPCPVGYHVPYSRNWENMENYWSNKPSGNAPYAKNVWTALNGINLTTIEGVNIWYPFQGFINKDGVYSPGHFHRHKDNDGSEHFEYVNDVPIVEVWSSLINRHDSDDTGLQDETVNDSPYRFMFTNDYGAMLSDDYSNRTRGLAVRCVSDNTNDVVKDLSASQTANCYMIHDKGYYKFNATVRGNGVGSLLPLGGTVTAEINGGLSTTIDPYKVDILWWQGDFTKGDADFPKEPQYQTRTSSPDNMCISLLDGGVITEDGYASFVINDFKEGNAVLAAYDRVGNILWTWHIWMTDKPEDKMSGNYTKMDRFLGATFAPVLEGTNSDLDAHGNIDWGTGEQQATLGFYYQWGRKDPIIGPSDCTTQTGSSTGSTATSAGWWKKESTLQGGTVWNYYTNIQVESSASIPDVVKNPTAFYKSLTAAGGTSSQWFPETFADGYTNVALWGYAVASQSIQGQTFSKTMHDPCPPGYRTPFHHSWKYSDSERYAEGEWGGAVNPYSWSTGGETSFDWDGGIVTNKTHFEKMWFPYAGLRNPLNGRYELVGKEGHMNTGMPMGNYETRTFWYSQSTSGQDAGGKGSAYGMMVRCMKE